jgi:Zn-dependent protease with chaperone function
LAFVSTFGLSLACLILWSTGALSWLDDRARREARARSIWGPMVAAGTALAFFAGWAIVEPSPADEHTPLVAEGLTLLAGLAIGRALLRACRSLLGTRDSLPAIATLGLFRCRIVVSEAFARAARAEVLAAALAHEAAHARRRDPLRIWLAQLATDLTFPLGGGGARLSRWLFALETERDDEAIRNGASPTALAESILLAARLDARAGAGPAARMTGDGHQLAFRVRRLLAADAASRAHATARGRRWFLVVPAALVGSLALGALYGDALLSLVPGVGR